MKKSPLTHVKPEADTSFQTKSILESGPLHGTLLEIAAGATTPASDSPAGRVIFVAQGEVTVTEGAANNVMLDTNETLHIAPDRALAIRNHGKTPARLFVLDLPIPRREPELAVLS